MFDEEPLQEPPKPTRITAEEVFQTIGDIAAFLLFMTLIVFGVGAVVLFFFPNSGF